MLHTTATVSVAILLGAVICVGQHSGLNVFAEEVGEPTVYPTFQTSVATYNVACVHRDLCEFYRGILLVIKLNPVRLLWLDLLLNMYSTAFEDIVFFSALRKGDSSNSKYLLVGQRRIPVLLLDDNYGFCDHAAVAESMRRWPHFRGYIFLTDDLFFMFWQMLSWNQSVIWKQRPSFGKQKIAVGESMQLALSQIHVEFPSLASIVNVNHLPFAATSGIYYVPNDPEIVLKFRRISTILLKYRTYNEWGTPTLLHAIAEGKPNALLLRGKLVWGMKRLLSRRILTHSFHWYHPVRANSETFARLLHYVHRTQLTPQVRIDVDVLFNVSCMNCATHPELQRATKGLFHSCVEDSFESCGPIRPLGEYAVKYWESFRAIRFVGGRVVVPPERLSVENPLELRHEGFWGANITRYVYEKYYRKMNCTRHSSIFFRGYPDCCSIQNLR